MGDLGGKGTLSLFLAIIGSLHIITFHERVKLSSSHVTSTVGTDGTKQNDSLMTH